MSKSGVTAMEEEIASSESVTVDEKPLLFDLSKPPKLYCLNTATLDSTEASQRQWCGRNETIEFLQRSSANEIPVKESSSKPQSLILIAGRGNGTLLGLSLDRSLFDLIMQSLDFPTRVEQTMKSIHGVFARFIEHRSHGRKSLLIFFSTPKSPVREIFCVMRICLTSSSTTCLFFDGSGDNLKRVIKRVTDSGPASKLIRQNPLALMVMILLECGYTSEAERQYQDNFILQAEVQTRASSWKGTGKSEDLSRKKNVRSPADFYSVMSVLHLCQNNLMFVGHAIEFEADAWEFFRRLSNEGEEQKWFKLGSSDRQWQATRDEIDFELVHTKSRKAQIRCLKERVGVQIALINNMIAHQETSQTSLIAVLALVFAPASLIASIFGADIFPTDGRSWVPFVASTFPTTLATLAIGLFFLDQQLVVRAWWNNPSKKEMAEKQSAGEGKAVEQSHFDMSRL
ncbi:hypothetical protein QQZ08_006230 [Neonectria magnoliae]|uniref:Uncharacterized protein n=1 Tax=Neonectria magnoliae TaxID=2732573 RepID=A0ABR1I306_9HYPO